MTTRRPQGSGSIRVRGGSYYGSWYDEAGRKVQRRLGPVRSPGTRDGLTKLMAEAQLRDAMRSHIPTPVAQRLGVQEVGERLIAHLTTTGRKKSTTQAYESYLRVHLVPYFGDKALTKITRHDVEAFAANRIRHKQSIKSTRNYLGFLHSIFTYAVNKGWAAGNPVALAEMPAQDSSHDIRFLTHEELAAVVKNVPDDDLGRVEGVMYLTAAMTGMRQGELLGLRWIDVDWVAHKIRVRQSFVRGEFGTPKSQRSSRAVPFADKVAAELERHYQRSHYQDDTDLVFCHPHTGKPIDRSRLLKRFKAAVKRAKVRTVRFHDLRHTFGTTMAAHPKVSMRQLQEWMGHRDLKTTLIYADYAPGSDEASLVEQAFTMEKPDDPGAGHGQSSGGAATDQGAASVADPSN